MKKVMLATWLLAIGGFAQAQSSVTLYGRIDTGLEYMSGLTNGSGRSVSRLRAESGDWGTGMFGLKGVEDIGGGTKVIFQLEGGLNSMVGQVGSGTTIFNRWAYVGVQNDTYGTLTAGRMLWISNGSGTSTHLDKRRGRRRRSCAAATGKQAAITSHISRRNGADSMWPANTPCPTRRTGMQGG